jgi:hypothetical protein
MPRAKRLFCLFIGFVVLSLGACASSMKRHSEELNKKIISGDFESAAKFVEDSQKKYGSSNALLYYLDDGLMRHLSLDYALSNSAFENAKTIFNDYYTKSISAALASYVSNDLSKPYYGRDYDRAYINVFCALNFLQLSKPQEAAVEARQTDIFFRTLNTTSRARNFYNDDPFIRYFMGIVYEDAGYINDAYISYKLALNGYKRKNTVAVPKDLPVSLARTMQSLGLFSEIETLKKEYAVTAKTPQQDDGEIIIICYNGFIPKKVSNVISVSLGNAWLYVDLTNADSADKENFTKAINTGVSAFARDSVTVAIPKMQRVPNRIKSFSVSSADGQEVESVLVSDIALIAEKTFGEQLPSIYAKTLARAAVKYVLRKVAVNAVEQQTDSNTAAVTDTVLNIFSTISETADTRGWDSLPENIQMARFYVSSGEQEIVVSFNASNGDTVQTRKIKVDVEKGNKTFVIVRSFA